MWSQYLEEKRKANVIKSGMAADDVYDSTWRWFPKLQFLHDHIAIKFKTVSSLISTMLAMGSHTPNCSRPPTGNSKYGFPYRRHDFYSAGSQTIFQTAWLMGSRTEYRQLQYGFPYCRHSLSFNIISGQTFVQIHPSIDPSSHFVQIHPGIDTSTLTTSRGTRIFWWNVRCLNIRAR